MLTRAQLVALIATLGVALIVVFPAALLAFWWRRTGREAADEERHRLEQLENLGLPVPTRGEDLPGPQAGATGQPGAKGSATSSVRPSWRMYFCRGRDLGEAEIMGRSKILAGADETRLSTTPQKVDKGKSRARGSMEV